MHQIYTRSSQMVVGSDKNHINFIAADHTGKSWLHVVILLSWRTMRSTVKRGKVSLGRSAVMNAAFVRHTWNWHSTKPDWHSLVWKKPELNMTSRILSTSFCPFFWDTRYSPEFTGIYRERKKRERERERDEKKRTRERERRDEKREREKLGNFPKREREKERS